MLISGKRHHEPGSTKEADDFGKNRAHLFYCGMPGVYCHRMRVITRGRAASCRGKAQGVLSAVNERDYEKMYGMVSDTSGISKEDFIARNKNIYEGVEAKNLEIYLVKAVQTLSFTNINNKRF